MGFAATQSVALAGVDARVVEVECQINAGLPAFTIVGLPDASLAEARERVRAAFYSSGLAWPMQRITVGLLPAELPKTGSGLDLAIAVAIAQAADYPLQLPVAGAILVGEIGLDGRVHPVRGVLPTVLAAREAGAQVVVVPEANVAEARLISGIQVHAVAHLGQIIADGSGRLGPYDSRAPRAGAMGEGEQLPNAGTGEESVAVPDLSEVMGQYEARLALELAAAGGHHLMLNGPPGVGKTMLAERLPTILPDLDDEQAVMVTSVHSVAGILPRSVQLVRRPPFEALHHTATRVALVGGGSGAIKPGAVSRAHHGVLFLDEAPEFSPSVTDCLRQPLEKGVVTISRARQTVQFPAQFQLVLAANPCPCGHGHGKGERCRCTSQARRRYQQRLSGPLLDRIDIHTTVATPRLGTMEEAETSAQVRGRVEAARRAQQRRYRECPWQLNARVPGAWLREHTRAIEPQVVGEVIRLAETGRVSLRGMDRVLRLMWTMADLQSRPTPTSEDLWAALALREMGSAHVT